MEHAKLCLFSDVKKNKEIRFKRGDDDAAIIRSRVRAVFHERISEVQAAVMYRLAGVNAVFGDCVAAGMTGDEAGTAAAAGGNRIIF